MAIYKYDKVETVNIFRRWWFLCWYTADHFNIPPYTMYSSILHATYHTLTWVVEKPVELCCCSSILDLTFTLKYGTSHSATCAPHHRMTQLSFFFGEPDANFGRAWRLFCVPRISSYWVSTHTNSIYPVCLRVSNVNALRRCFDVLVHLL